MQIATLNSSVQTNSASIESHNFSIGDVSTIIDILRNRLYSNPIQTLTQEYISNARDSHREAGQKRPITVSLPTKLDSVLKIRDYGVGLDKERVRDVFVNYGTSTKRGDNVQTGGFGLGAKSAWAYTDSFCIVSHYNGVRCTYIAHTGKNKNGTFELIDECDTDEPNGVEVQIPVKEMDIQKFVNAVYRTTFFWDVKPELKGITNIEVPKVYADNLVAFKKNKTTIVQECNVTRSVFNVGYSNNKIYALIDGIPYDLARFCTTVNSARKITNLVKPNHITFISVDNGDIAVAASREEISNDENNINAIEKFCAVSLKDIVDIVTEEFDNDFTSLQSYVESYEKVGESFNYAQLPLTAEQKKTVFQYTEDGVDFTFDLLGNYTCDKLENITRWTLKKKRVKHYLESDKASYIEASEKSLVVINDANNAASVRSQKIRTLLGQGFSKVYEIVCKDGYGDKLKGICQARLLSEMQYERRAYNTHTGRIKENDEVQIRRLLTEYNEIKSQGIETRKLVDIEESDTKYMIVPFSKEEKFTDFNFARMVDFVNSRGWDVIRCGKRDYNLLVELDNVFEYEDVIENIAEYFPITDDQIKAAFFSGVQRGLHSFKRVRNQITCPQFVSLLEMYPDRVENNSTLRNVSEEFLTKYYPSYKVIKREFEAAQKLEKKILSMYPLLSHYFHGDLTAEYVVYINAKSQTIKK